MPFGYYKPKYRLVTKFGICELGDSQTQEKFKFKFKK